MEGFTLLLSQSSQSSNTFETGQPKNGIGSATRRKKLCCETGTRPRPPWFHRPLISSCCVSSALLTRRPKTSRPRGLSRRPAFTIPLGQTSRRHILGLLDILQLGTPAALAATHRRLKKTTDGCGERTPAIALSLRPRPRSDNSKLDDHLSTKQRTNITATSSISMAIAQ